MAKYYVNGNSQSSGKNEVHKEGCPLLHYVLKQTPLGEHSNDQSAIKASQKYYDNVNGCDTCCPIDHTKDKDEGKKRKKLILL